MAAIRIRFRIRFHIRIDTDGHQAGFHQNAPASNPLKSLSYFRGCPRHAMLSQVRRPCGWRPQARRRSELLHPRAGLEAAPR